VSLASTSDGGGGGKGFAPNRAKTVKVADRGPSAKVLFSSEEKTFATLRDWWLLELEGLWQCVVGMMTDSSENESLVEGEEWLSDLERTALRESVVMGGAELAAALYLCSAYPPDQRWASGSAARRAQRRGVEAAVPVAARVQDALGFTLEEVHEGRGGRAGRHVAGQSMEAWGEALIMVLKAHGVVDPAAPSVIGDRDIPDMSRATTFLGDFQLIPRMVETMGKAARALEGGEAQSFTADSNPVAFGPPVVILGGFQPGAESAMDDVLWAAGLEGFATVHCRKAWLKQPLAFVLDEALASSASGEEGEEEDGEGGPLVSMEEDLGDLGAPFVLLSGMTSAQTLAALAAYGDSPLAATSPGKVRLEGTRAGQSLLEHGAIFATPMPNSMVTVLEDLLGDFGRSLSSHAAVPANLVKKRLVTVDLKSQVRGEAADAEGQGEATESSSTSEGPLADAEGVLGEEISHILKGYADLEGKLLSQDDS